MNLIAIVLAVLQVGFGLILCLDFDVPAVLSGAALIVAGGVAISANLRRDLQEWVGLFQIACAAFTWMVAMRGPAGWMVGVALAVAGAATFAAAHLPPAPPPR